MAIIYGGVETGIEAEIWKWGNMLKKVENISYIRKRKRKSMEERKSLTSIYQLILEDHGLFRCGHLVQHFSEGTD